MKSPKTLIALAVLGTAFSLRSDDELALEQCPANVQETIRANARDGKVDEVKSIPLTIARSIWRKLIYRQEGRPESACRKRWQADQDA